jgi:hypothetical protein
MPFSFGLLGGDRLAICPKGELNDCAMVGGSMGPEIGTLGIKSIQSELFQ